MPILKPTAAAVERAAAALRRGELVAFPTETVYGLGANALDAEAVARIFAAKARPAWNPVIAHVATVEAARELTSQWPDRAERLAQALWPGPLTLVLARAPQVPTIVTAGQDTVAVRIPAHPVALALLEQAGVPVAAPSANRFMAVSPTTAQHVVDGLGDRVAMVLDGGACAVGIESTVLDLTGEAPRLLRYGGVSADTLADLLGEPVLEVPRTRVAERIPRQASERPSQQAPQSDAAHGLERQPGSAQNWRPEAGPQTAPIAPGMAERHYAPTAEAWLVDEPDVEEALRALASRTRPDTGHSPGDAALRVGLLTWRERSPLPALAAQAVEGSDAPLVHRALPPAAAAYARALYATLREFDAAGCTHLLIEAPPARAEWDAVRDRLQRASHPAA